MAKRSMNFSGASGSHLTLDKFVDTMKAMGKSDEEILAAVKELQQKRLNK